MVIKNTEKTLKQASAVDPNRLYTISEFCEAVRISRSTYSRLKSDGRGPYETRINGRLLVSEAEKNRWLRTQIEPRGQYITIS